jgi:SAM-dependent MidA family methyltransferase
MTPIADLLAAEIRARGPIPFRRFMEMSLYHPVHGYYRSARDPFGKQGDFYTAEQIQPVFGILMAARIRQLWRECGEPPDFTVVELGAGRREMAEAFAPWNYVPVDIASGALPERFRGVVFSNEFFDALPVDVAVWRAGEFREQLVGLREDKFHWETGGPLRDEAAAFLHRYLPAPEEGNWYEANLESLAWLERFASRMVSGFLLTIDYGYTRRESIRFPAGSLMGYHRHTARENVLEDPGSRDITAHVNFSALEEYGTGLGFDSRGVESLARTLLTAGEPDGFAAALQSGEDPARRMQLKTLLFGMGETFRVLLQRKRE